MQIILNGAALKLDAGETTIMDVLTAQGYADKIVAVAVNNDFLPKSAYAQTYVQDNDTIEIVAPMQGG